MDAFLQSSFRGEPPAGPLGRVGRTVGSGTERVSACTRGLSFHFLN